MNSLFKIANKFQKLIKISTHNATKESVEAQAKSLGLKCEIFGLDYNWSQVAVALDIYAETKNENLPLPDGLIIYNNKWAFVLTDYYLYFNTLQTSRSLMNKVAHLLSKQQLNYLSKRLYAKDPRLPASKKDHLGLNKFPSNNKIAQYIIKNLNSSTTRFLSSSISELVFSLSDNEALKLLSELLP